MRTALALLGVAVLGFAWFGPWPARVPNSFFSHMAIHISVVAVAAPLIAAGTARLVPVHMPGLFLAPVPASLFEFVVIWGWHFPALHDLARASTGGFIAEQASFLASGLLLWVSALHRTHAVEDSRGAGVAALLLTSMHMILLGTLLVLARRPLYGHGSAAGAEAMLAEQQAGGILMLIGGGLPYLAGGLWLVWQLLQPPQPVEVAAPRSAVGTR
ncbi:MAG TPA: cytochrome c oxidase assembly protein [Woeseiaceae bacterium]|nr:cytochrome c oxidase assembly protein [Woeseiaceae bacterium]